MNGELRGYFVTQYVHKTCGAELLQLSLLVKIVNFY